MKTKIHILTLAIVTILIVSCNMSNVEPQKGIQPIASTTDSTTSTNNSDSILVNDNIPHTERNIKPIKIVEPIKKNDTILNAAKLDTTTSNAAPAYDISTEINNLENLLNLYTAIGFKDCISFESAVKDFTVKFFAVVQQININDSSSINELKKLENFLEVFEPHFARAEDECPDLYNEYMEFLDEYTQIYNEKLEIMFGE